VRPFGLVVPTLLSSVLLWAPGAGAGDREVTSALPEAGAIASPGVPGSDLAVPPRDPGPASDGALPGSAGDEHLKWFFGVGIALNLGLFGLFLLWARKQWRQS